MRPTNLEKNQEVFRYRLCKLYAWGVPFLIIISGYIMDTFPHFPEYLRPQFDEKTYWFHGTLIFSINISGESPRKNVIFNLKLIIKNSTYLYIS